MADPHAATAIFPDLYAPWLRDLLGGEVPAETEATCHDCAMAKPPAPGEAGLFDRRMKCCTFYPSFPNYVVGRILAFESPMRGIVAGTGVGTVTPLGVGGDPRYNLIYTQGGVDFGRDLSMRCPFLADVPGTGETTCSVWPERPAPCATFYCRFVRGRRGAEFWTRMNHLMTAVEESLRWWCVLRSDLDREVVARLADRQRSGVAPTATVPGDLWGSLANRREAFFSEAADRVADLAWADVVRIGGSSVEVPARLVEDAYARLLAEDLPGRLRVGEYRITAHGEDRVRIVGYHVYDPVEIPHELLKVLFRFDGSTPDEALRRLREEDGLTVDETTVRALLDQGILLPA
jgi:hypothetical protein